MAYVTINKHNEALRTTDTRTTLNLPAEMTRAIDNYWHSEQLRSRNEAIRELLAYALDAKLAQPAKEQRR